MTTRILGEYLAYDGLRDMEKPSQIHCRDRRIVVERVVGKWLTDEDASVVDQGVDAPEALDCLIHDQPGGLDLADVPPHREKVGCIGGFDRSRHAHDRISGLPEAFRRSGTDALRSSGHHRDPA
jgi:hypothetical protein